MSESLSHLEQHHGDFAAFRDAMIETSAGRFGPIWWGVWAQHITPMQPRSIVDLGTGPGLLLPQLRTHAPKARIIGVEIQPLMLEVARANAASADAELLEADLAQPLPLEDGIADVVTSVMVFHELAFPPPLLHEAARLLRPGGRLLLWDWVKRPLEAYLGDEPLTPGKLQHFREHCLFAAEDLLYLCRRAGLEPVELIGRRGGHYAMIVAEKRPGEG